MRRVRAHKFGADEAGGLAGRHDVLFTTGQRISRRIGRVSGPHRPHVFGIERSAVTIGVSLYGAPVGDDPVAESRGRAAAAASAAAANARAPACAPTEFS